MSAENAISTEISDTLVNDIAREHELAQSAPGSDAAVARFLERFLEREQPGTVWAAGATAHPDLVAGRAA